MSTISHVRRAAFVGLISFAMVATAGLAAAQEDGSAANSSVAGSTESPSTDAPAPEEKAPAEVAETTEESPGEEPTEEPQRPLVSVLADCYDGFKSLAVWIDGAEGVTYEVTLTPDDGSAALTESSTKVDDSQRAIFVAPPPAGYTVTVVGSDGSEGGSEVTVERCSSLEPGDPKLTVDVKCVNDLGTVFIRVANPGSGEVSSFSLDIDDLTLYDNLQLAGGFFVDIVEQDFEDGTYKVRLFDAQENEVASEEFTVACAPVVEPTTTTPAPVTTTTPAPQGGSTPSGGGLASTGAAVGGLAVLGLVALAMGGALVLVGRRRNTTTPE